MKTLQHGTIWLVLASALKVTGAEPAPQPPAANAALVRFHTACASCHAGECSGRLSFQSGRPGAERHILRYAPSANAAVVRELYVHLTRMKRSCEVELPALEKPQTSWTAQQLREWNNPDADAWFVPLGELKAGKLTLELDPGVEALGRAQLLDAELETLVETPLAGRPLQLNVELKRPTRCYLLVRGAKALRSLEVIAPRGV